jgi:hypothetical protein
MEFPSEIVKLIKEYSMPITRPDWRTCCKFSYHNLKLGVHIKTRQRELLLLFCPTHMYQYYKSKNKIFGFHRYRNTYKDQDYWPYENLEYRFID